MQAFYLAYCILHLLSDILNNLTFLFGILNFLIILLVVIYLIIFY